MVYHHTLVPLNHSSLVGKQHNHCLAPANHFPRLEVMEITHEQEEDCYTANSYCTLLGVCTFPCHKLKRKGNRKEKEVT